MKSKNQDHVLAHELDFRNRKALEQSEICGCFYCLKTCDPDEITEWIPKRNFTDETGLCPHCRTDALLGSSSGFPTTEEFLTRMQKEWFGKPKENK